MKRKVRHSKGFTLVEMVIVVVVLSTVVLIVYPRIAGAVDSLRISAAAQRLGNDIRYVRDLALSDHGTYGITFDSGNNSYTVFQLIGAAKTTITDPYTGKPMVVDFDTIPEYTGVTLGSVSMCQSSCTSQELRINAFGNPLDANNTAYTAQSSVALQLGSNTKTIQVTPETSFTKVV